VEYANVSVRFPEELDRELERFIEETNLYTNKSEFIKESVRRRLVELNDEPAIAALRLEQLLARAEQRPIPDDELRDRLETLGRHVDDSDLSDAVASAREDAAEDVLDQA
jgi:Arc/MetJ-type ribon-helix-helix transcriptional regulator